MRGDTLMMHWRYGRYVWRHKVAVYRAGRRLSLGRARLLLHDWTKLLPSEWGPAARHFYGPEARARQAQMQGLATGYFHQSSDDLAYEVARNAHQKRHRHHWEWWCLPDGTGGIMCLEMDIDDMREMWADWQGAGDAQGKPDVRAWYVANRDRIRLHPNTRRATDAHFGVQPEAIGMPADRRLATH